VSATPSFAMPRDVAARTERHTTLTRRFRANLKLKVGLYLLLSSIFCAFYFGIQRLPWLHPRAFPLSYIDRATGFHPAAIYAYQSVFLLIPLFPFLTTTKNDLLRFVKGFLLLCGACFFTFLIFPVFGPRPENAEANRLMQVVFSYDKNLNAFPSLHAGLAAYSVLFGFSIARGNQELRWLAILGTFWAGLILISTIATKQHYFVDIPPAIFLAWLANRGAWAQA
jgi:membrane-associated phospholipid phosphatase